MKSYPVKESHKRITLDEAAAAIKAGERVYVNLAAGFNEWTNLDDVNHTDRLQYGIRASLTDFEYTLEEHLREYEDGAWYPVQFSSDDGNVMNTVGRWRERYEDFIFGSCSVPRQRFVWIGKKIEFPS